ncbi:hypothetical protein CRE_19976 [Caenorhabditis remanei]|uniref:Uncharacterized protein n=1 Tax=Caenorhabditis remanei TaxID=31234 RepID=E3N8G8_CAERE|nr:hypothetical protein CRE_19976 [Caenorhabditis remanei]
MIEEKKNFWLSNHSKVLPPKKSNIPVSDSRFEIENILGMLTSAERVINNLDGTITVHLNERRSLESRHQAARTMLRSQDEGLKHREEEHRQVKSKLVERKPDSAT